MTLRATGEARIWLAAGMLATGLSMGVSSGAVAASTVAPDQIGSVGIGSVGIGSVEIGSVATISDDVSSTRTVDDIGANTVEPTLVAQRSTPIGKTLAELYGSVESYLGIVNDQMHFDLMVEGQLVVAKVGLTGPLTIAGVFPNVSGFEEFDPDSIDANGDVYNAPSDGDGCRLQRWSLSTNTVVNLSAPTAAGNWSCAFAPSPADGPMATAQLARIGHLVFDSTGNAYFAERINYSWAKIRKYNPTTGQLSTLAGTGIAPIDGKLSVDSSNRIYFTEDSGTGIVVKRIDTTTGVISTVFDDVGGSLTVIEVTPNGTIYLACDYWIYECDGTSMKRISSDGTVSQFIGTGVAGYSGDGGPASSARVYLSRLLGSTSNNSMVFSQDIGTYYTGVLDPLSSRSEVLRLVNIGGTISTISGLGDVSVDGNDLFWGIRSGLGGLMADDRLVVDPTFELATGATETLIELAWRPRDGVVTWARRPSGAVEMYGSYGTGAGYVHARQSLVLLDNGFVGSNIAVNADVPIDPQVIDYDAAGNVYYVPQGECRIVKRTPAGAATTLLGLQICGQDDPLDGFVQLAVRHDGVVYFAEEGSRDIFRIGTNGVTEIIASAPDDCDDYLPDRLTGNGAADEVCFTVSQALAVDRGGNVFVSDYETDSILRLSHDGVFSDLTPTTYWNPDNMVFAPDGTLYFDTWDSIWKMEDVAATRPAAPTVVSASAGDGSVTVSWTAPSNGGSPITGYTVTGGGGCTTATNSCTISGLTNNSGYSFTVAASNLVGTSAASSPVTARPMATPNAAVLSALPATLAVPDTTPDVGVPFVLSVSGFTPFEWVVISLQSVPQVLNSVQADAQGTISVPVTIPAGTASGAHTLSALGSVSGVGFRAPVSVGATFGLTALDSPKRLVDTRSSGGRFGSSSASGVSVRRVQVAGATTYQGAASGLPSSGIGAVAMNVTVVDGRDKDGFGFVTVYPCASTSTPVPDASNLNFSGGQTVPNSVLAPLSSDGYVCFSIYGDAHLLVDVSGWVPSGAGLTALDSPKRLVDTRSSGGRFGSSSASGVSVRRVQVAGATTYQGAASGLPSSGIGAVAMNVTVVDGRDKDGFGFVTVYPCASTSTPVPDASNLNFSGGQTVPNSVLAPLSSDGYVCFSIYGDAHLLVDVSGWVPSGAGLTALDSPKRLVDTRSSGGRFGSSSASGVSVRRVQVAGATTYQGAASGLPSSGIGAVAMNVTVVDGRDKDGFGFVTVYPCASTSTPVPDASNLNFAGGQTVPNSVLAPLSSDGYVCFSIYGDAHLLLDVSGWMAPAV